MRTEVATGSACAPIAAMVATSPLRPPAPLGSLALKLITQAGAGASCSGSPGATPASGGGVVVIGPKSRPARPRGARPRRWREVQEIVSFVAYVPINPWLLPNGRGYNSRRL